MEELEEEKQRFISLHFLHPNGDEWFNLNDDLSIEREVNTIKNFCI